MKKRCIRSNKGLSPVIATVLLIMLVFVLFALIFLWMKGLISEQLEKNEQAIENICPSVNFQIDLVDENSYLEVINRGSVNIYNLEIKMSDYKGDSKLYDLEEILSVSIGETKKQEVAFDMNGAPPKKITVYPVLLGSIKGGMTNKPYTCMDMGQTLNLI